MKIENATLPWETVTRKGYGVFDLKCVIDATQTLMVKRTTPDDRNPGAFVVMVDGVRISENHHARRPDAMAEAERYFYDLPDFAGSNTGQTVKGAIAMGRQAYINGASIYQNPFSEATSPVDRSHWLQGWLEAFGGQSSQAAIRSLEATARANTQLESDNTYLTASVRVTRLAINYAVNLGGEEGITFLRLWATSNDADEINKQFPGWKDYRDADPQAVKPKPSTDQ